MRLTVPIISIDPRPNSAPKIFVYMSQCKQRNPILFFQKPVYHFAMRWKNSFVPINRIPGAILSLIQSYWECQCIDTDGDLVALTHRCCGWRRLFLSHLLLWACLDFMNIGKTKTYIKRSRSPLEVTIFKNKEFSLEDAFLPTTSHIKQFKTLMIVGN